MRVALFGGSFDPPHLGHLRIAQAAADRLRLDRVWLAPVAVQPLKRGLQPPPAGFADRMAMVGLLLEAAGDSRLELSSLDAPRADGKPNYTYETLARLRAGLALERNAIAAGQRMSEAGLGHAGPGSAAVDQIPAPKNPVSEAPATEAEVFLLTGADSLLTLAQWHCALELVLSTQLIVATRPGFPLAALSEPLLRLLGPGASLLRAGAGSLALGLEALGSGVERLVLTRGEHEADGLPQTATLYLLTGLNEDISATAVRASLAEKGSRSAPVALSPVVAAYIRAHGLYR